MDSGDRRTRILAAAAALFMANGYAGVSMDDVLSEVGGSKATLYRYFADKTDLFRSAVEMLIGQRSQPLRSFQPSRADIVDALAEFGRHFADVVLDPRAIALHRLVTAEAERVPGLGRTFFELGPADGTALLADYLRTQCADGVLDLDDPLLAAAQLYHAMLGTLQMRLLVNAAERPTPDEVEAHIAAAVHTFLSGHRTTRKAASTAGKPA